MTATVLSRILFELVLAFWELGLRGIAIGLCGRLKSLVSKIPRAKRSEDFGGERSKAAAGYA